MWFISLTLFSVPNVLQEQLSSSSMEFTVPQNTIVPTVNQVRPPTTTVIPTTHSSVNMVQTQPPTSPPIIVSSPIKVPVEREITPVATTVPSFDRKMSEPLATFSIEGDDITSSPKHVKPPPPGATHCKGDLCKAFLGGMLYNYLSHRNDFFKP